MAKIFTKIITNTNFVITKQMGFNAISIVLISGTGTIIGGLVVNSNTSDLINLVIDEPVNISVNTPNVLEDITINCTSGGVIKLMARQ